MKVNPGMKTDTVNRCYMQEISV